MLELLKKWVKQLFTTGFFYIFGSSIVNKIIGFLSSTILVHVLSKGEYGVFTYAWNIYSIIVIFSGLGMDSAIIQLCSEKPKEKKYCSEVTSCGAQMGVRFNFFLCIIILFIGQSIPLLYDGTNTLLKTMCLLPLFQLGYNIICAVLRSQKRNKEYSILSVVNTLCILCGSVLGALLFREIGLLIGYYLAYTVSVILGVFYFKVNFWGKISAFKSYKKELLSIGLVSMVNNGMIQLLYLLDIFVLGLVSVEETVLASYKVATIIPTALNFIPFSLMIYLYPYFAEHKDDGRWCIDKYKQLIMGLGGMNLMISIVMFIAAKFIIGLFFGKQYLDSVIVFRLLSINYFFSGTFRGISGNLLITQRKLKFNTFVTVLSGVVNVIANCLFIPMWGSIGAAIATVLAILVSSVLSTSYLIYTFWSVYRRNKGC